MKKIIRWVVGCLVVIIALTVMMIAPVDDSPITKRAFYINTIRQLENFKPVAYPANGGFKATWAKINITPSSPMPMAGYAPRDHFDSVHDSVFVRILGINNGTRSCFFISADLLLFPPALKNKILDRAGDKFFLYFTATHAHSSLGGWDNSTVGNLILGDYHEDWLNSLADKIISEIKSASEQMKPATIDYFEADASEYVENRLDSQHGLVDGKIRGLKITRSDSTKGLFVSYSAHPTNISHLSLALSGDYPAALVTKAERRDYNFAMFASGMVGSHRVKGIQQNEFALCDTLASKLYTKTKGAVSTTISDATLTLGIAHVEYGPSQMHIFQKFKVRDWVFNALFTTLQGDIRYLKIGNIVMLGTPCDFSGEIFTRDRLENIAAAKGEKLFITSFNGNYVGYITYDDHYGHSEQEEVMAMNWVGPHFGSYYSEIVKALVKK